MEIHDADRVLAAVWNHQITELGDPNLVKKFKWKKELRFMGLYQKLVGIRVED